MKRIEFDTYIVAFALSVLVGLFVWGFSRPAECSPVPVPEVEAAAAPEVHQLREVVSFFSDIEKEYFIQLGGLVENTFNPNK